MAGRIPPDAFDHYFSLGPGRSYQAVAAQYGVSKRAVTKHAAKEDWQGRLKQLEEKARELSDKNAVESLDEMAARHLKILKAVQGKALGALKSLSLGNAMDAIRALDMSIKQERLVRGEPSDRTVVSVEETIRSEYERWMTVTGGSEDAAETR
jgi:hypothetical protein